MRVLACAARRRPCRQHRHGERPRPKRTAALLGVGDPEHRPARLRHRRRNLHPRPHDRTFSNAERVQSGVREFLATGRLNGLPMLIVHGRSDDRVPVTFSSRPYVGLNSLQDGAGSQLRYIEVTNAEHFGTDLPGFDNRMVPLVPYHLRALDVMWAHLTAGAPLPDSQVAHTTRRGGKPGHAPPLQAAGVPPIAPVPAEADCNKVSAGQVFMPD